MRLWRMISSIYSCGPIADAPGICKEEFVENEPCRNILSYVAAVLPAIQLVSGIASPAPLPVAFAGFWHRSIFLIWRSWTGNPKKELPDWASNSGR